MMGLPDGGNVLR